MDKSKKEAANDRDKLKKEFELREKRLMLVYKMLYVLTAMWAAIFLAYASNPNDATPLYCGFLAALTTSIMNITFFIFSELRCLRITTTVDYKIKDIADEKYLSIWDTFGLSLWVSMFLTYIHMALPCIVTQKVITYVIVLGVIVNGIGTLLIKDKKVILIIRNSATALVLYAFFSLLQFSSST